MIHAFIDESGDLNPDPTIEGASPYFVLNAIIVKDRHLKKLIGTAKIVSSKFFGGNEIKASRLGKEISRRITIINEFHKSVFQYAAIVVPKARLAQKRITTKQQLYMLAFRALRKYIDPLDSNISYYCDELGTEDFRKDILRHFSQVQPNLFYTKSIKFIDSKNSPGIQLSDILANTIFNIFSNKIDGRVKLLLHEKQLVVDVVPPKSLPKAAGSSLPKESRFDYFINSHCLQLSHSFIETYENSDDSDCIAQVTTLQYLSDEVIYGDPLRFILTHELISHLETEGLHYENVTTFRTKVIAKLRDKGVIISSGNDGYKIPTSTSDLQEYVDNVRTRTLPQLERLQKARKDIKFHTNNLLDILSELDSSTLKHILDRSF